MFKSHAARFVVERPIRKGFLEVPLNNAKLVGLDTSAANFERIPIRQLAESTLLRIRENHAADRHRRWEDKAFALLRMQTAEDLLGVVNGELITEPINDAIRGEYVATGIPQAAALAGPAERLSLLETAFAAIAIGYWRSHPGTASDAGHIAARQAIKFRLTSALEGWSALLADPARSASIYRQRKALLGELNDLHTIVRAYQRMEDEEAFSGEDLAFAPTTPATDQLAQQIVARLREALLDFSERERPRLRNDLVELFTDKAREMSNILDAILGDDEPAGLASLADGSGSLFASLSDDPASDPLVSALRTAAATEALTLHTELTPVRAQLLALGENDAPTGLTLDLGTLRVGHVFGEFLYNRQTQFFRGTFGGNLAFTDLGAEFVLSEGTLQSDGAFFLAGQSRFPLGGPGLSIESSLEATGTAGGDFSATGDATLTVGEGPLAGTYAATLAYDSASREMRFTAATEDLSFGFGEDAVFFPQSLTVRINGSDTASGEIEVSGSAGFLARGEGGSTPADFLLFVEDLNGRILLSDTGFTLALTEGTLRLPETITAGSCGGGGGPAIALSPAAPLQLAWDAATNSVTFSGALAFANLRLALPEFGASGGDPLVSLEICAATLTFFEGSAPVFALTGAQPGLFTANLPSGPLALAITDLLWPLDGLPAGTISLPANTVLVEETDLFSLLLTGPAAGGCPAGALSFAFADGQPSFALSGGLRFTFAPEILADAASPTPTPVALAGCGALSWTAGAAPSLNVAAFSAAGDVVLGGSGGLRLSVDSFVVENPASLLQPGAPDPFRLLVNNAVLRLDSGAFFAVPSGSFSTDGAFALAVNAAGGAEGFDLNLAASAARTAAGAFSFGGAGTFTATDSDLAFAVALDYSFDPAGGQNLAFSGSSGSLVLADDVVVFEGGFSFAVTGMSGNRLSGTASIGGASGVTVGLFRKPGGGDPTPEDFFLSVLEARLDFVFGDDIFGLALSGQLQLPADAFAPTDACPDLTEAPSITLPVENPLSLVFDAGGVSFSGAFLFEDFCFALPDFPGFFVYVESTLLAFSSSALPVLSQVNGVVSLPIPALGDEDAAPVLFGVSNGEWALDGLPTGTLALLSAVDLFSFPMGDGPDERLRFTLLPQGGGCPGGTFLTRDTIGNRSRLTLSASMRVSLPLEFLAPEDGGSAGLTGQACGGSVTILSPAIPGDAPEFAFALPDLSFATTGTWILGGSDGFRLTNASVSLENIGSLLTGGTGGSAFTLRFGGELFVEPLGVGVAVQNAGFRFETGRPLPTFLIPSEGELQLDADLLENIPITITRAGFRVKNYAPGTEVRLEDLFDPTNVEINLSAEAFLPSRESPVISGRLDNLVVGLEFNDTLGIYLPQLQVNGLGLGLDGSELGPLKIKGEVYIGNISDPPNLFFAGQVGGVLNGTGVEVLLALNLRGLIGACISVQGGAAGIPIGPTGFLVTGATGGVSFASVFGDPCEFSTYIQIPASGPPLLTPGPNPVATNDLDDPDLVVPETAMSWDELAEFNRSLSTDGSAPLGDSGGELCSNAENPICALANCPPGTVNILCQPHPDQDAYPGRIIFKFSALPRELITEAVMAYDLVVTAGQTDLLAVFQAIRSFTPAEKEVHALGVLAEWAGAAEIAANLAEGAFSLVDFLTPPLPDALVGEPWDDIRATMVDGLFEFRETVEKMLLAALTGNVPNTPDELLDGLALILGKGVPCTDVTVSLAGNFSYAGVSAVLNVEGGVTLSTTGTAGVAGRLNLLGIPVGTVEAYVSATDNQGLPNPSFCGFANIELGPLFLGRLDIQAACDGCVTDSVVVTFEFLESLESLGDTYLSTLLAEVLDPDRFDPAVDDPIAEILFPNTLIILDPAAPEAERDRAAQEFQAIIGYLLTNIPPVGESYYDALLNYIVDLYGAINPILQVCGEAHPKLFGFSLTGGNRPGAVQFRMEKNEIRGNLIFSPSFVLGNAFFCLGSFGVLCQTPIIPALDEAALGFSFGFDELDRPGLEKALTDPLAYASDQVGSMLRRSVLTFGYQFSPFGFKLGGGSARFIMPNFDFHPTRPEIDWAPPALLNRRDLLIRGAETGVLCDGIWLGSGPELADLFPEQSPAFRDALAGLDLSRDFFPHGGFLGAAYIELPSIIYNAPPYKEFQALFFPEDEGVTGIPDRIAAATAIVDQWLLATVRAGELSVYLPLPNPPAQIWALEKGPDAFLDALLDISFADMINAPASLYPLELAFMRGRFDGQILGVPVLAAEIIAEPAEGLFRIAATVPEFNQDNEPNWLTDFVSGGIVFEIRTASYISELSLADIESPEAKEPADHFHDVLDILNDGSLSELERLGVLYEKITDTLPKVSLSAELAFQIPEGLEDLLQVVSGGVGAGFYGFSPNFNPDYPLNTDPDHIRFPDPNPDNPGPYTLAVRRGGLVMGGHFRFGYFPSGNDADNLIINVPEATLAVTGPAGLTPFGITARLRVDDVRIPAWTNPFNDSSTPFEFREGILFFNSNPDLGADFITVGGEIKAFDLGNFLQLTPLGGGDAWLGASVSVSRSSDPTASLPNVSLSIDPTEARLPFLGENFRGMIYGSIDPVTGAETPFTFSTVEGQPWAATLRVEALVELRSPFDVNGPVLLRAFPEVEFPAGSGQLVPAAFEVSINGVGAEFFEMRVEIPNGMNITLFPGQSTESHFRTGDASATCIVINSNGRIYFDSGTRTLALANGAIEVEGRLEFGFEPFVLTPALGPVPAQLAFGNVAARDDSATQTFSVQNTGFGRLVLDADVIAGNDSFTAQPNRLVLGPLEVGEITVRYLPQAVAAHTGTLALTSPFGSANIALTGTGTGTVGWHANPASSLAFGSLRLGDSTTRPILVSNPGTANLVISGTTVNGPYAISPGFAVIAPGAAREFAVTFTPVGTGTQNGSVVFATNSPLPNRTISLTGSGSTTLWHRQRMDGPDLHGGHQIIASAGWVAGDNGSVLRTFDSGRLWEEVPAGAHNWRDIVFSWVAANAPSIPANLRGFLVADDGAIARTLDSGATWSPYLLGEIGRNPDVSWRTAARRSRDRMVLAGAFGGIALIATEQEAAGDWEVHTFRDSGPINGVAFRTERFADNTGVPIGIAVGDNGTILRTEDGGKTWDVLPVPPGVPADTRFVAVSCSQQNTLSQRRFLIIGEPDIVLTSNDNTGLTWTRRNMPASLRGSLTSGAWTANTAGQLGTSEGQIWRLLDGGASFTEQFLQAPARMRKVLHNRQTSETGGDSGNIWILGDGGNILRRPTTVTGPFTSVTTEAADFGGGAVNATAFRRVVITNGGTSPSNMAVEDPSSGSFSVFPESQTIPPGESAVFTVLFKPASPGPATATFIFSDGTNSHKIDFSGYGQSARWTRTFSPTFETLVGLEILAPGELVLAAEGSLWRTVNGGGEWIPTLFGTAGPLRALAFSDPFNGFAVGGAGGTGTPTPLKSTLYSTKDAGVTWTPVNSPTPTSIAAVTAFRNAENDLIAQAVTSRFGSADGRVIGSSKDPLSWLIDTTSPLERTDGFAITHTLNGRIFAAVRGIDEGELYTRSGSAAPWVKVINGNKLDLFRAVHFLSTSSSFGWVVGDSGNFWRTTSGGATTGSWTNLTNPALGDIRDVRFITSQRGWIVSATAGDTRIHETLNGGFTWHLQHRELRLPGAPEIRGLAGSSLNTLHAYGTEGAIWKFQPAIPNGPGYLDLPVRVNVGTVAVGQTSDFLIRAVNLGARTVHPLTASIETESSPTPFSAELAAGAILPGEMDAPARVIFRPTSTGTFHAVLHLGSDALNGDVTIEVVGTAVPPVSSVIIDSIPVGAALAVDGFVSSATRVFTVVDGASSSTNWQRGAERTLTAPATRVHNGVNYAFSHWSQGGSGRILTAVESGGAQRFTAIYVPSLPPPVEAPPPIVFAPTICGEAGPPDDVAQGPWLKISHAVVRFPTLEGGHTAAVEGSLFLSLFEANGVLRTSAFQLTAGDTPNDFELVAVTAGSWRFDLVGPDFRFAANNPGLRLFDRPALPPSTFAFRASWDPAFPFDPPIVAGEFATLGTLPLLPSVAELGPTTVQFAVSPDLGLGVEGTISLIRRPDGPGFFFQNRPFSFTVGEPDPDPIPGTGTTTLVDFGFAALRGDGASSIVLQQDAAGVFTVGLRDLRIDGVASPANPASPPPSARTARWTSRSTRSKASPSGPSSSRPSHRVTSR
ncbi:MAG: choice-of-anchor D domain-containing protein [Opitutales bacterium]|nr:choice-of-anchor D domain-containing protein [Opitutales bacterium]